MNLRNATLKAADQIGSHPESFHFMSLEAPDLSCGTPGCALGWIGFYADVKPVRGQGFVTSVAEAMGISQGEFYTRMDECCGGDLEWIDKPDVCAQGLRVYAERHFPAAT